MKEIRYEIERSKHEGKFVLVRHATKRTTFTGLAFGTWRECAEKLRELHPKARLVVNRDSKTF